MVNTLTYERLHEVLHYDPDSGVFTWKETRGRTAVVGQVAGSKHNKGYSIIGISGKSYWAHRLAWLYIYGYFPEHDIDHINRIKHDNRLVNLREVSRSCNMRNSGQRVDNTSGVSGVDWHNETGKWRVRIKFDNKERYLGLYTDFDDAVCTRLAAEQSIGWEGCDSTSSAYQYVKQNIQEKKQ